MKLKILISFLFLYTYLGITCLNAQTSYNNGMVAHLPNDTIIKLKNKANDLSVYIKIPHSQSIKGTIIILPGWNLPVSDWCTKTTLCQKALEKGYILIMPEMGKSVYSYQLFPETRKDWLMYTTRRWFIDTLIRYFQDNYKLLLPGQNNFLLGLSTGARGVALLSLDCPEIFKKSAALSGDYDQTQMPSDNLMKGYYGTITDFPGRWKGMDNVVYRFKKLEVPIYLGHGKADQVVPCSQTIQFADSLRKYKPGLLLLHIDEQAGHTYTYWNSEVDNVIKFFMK